MVLQGKFHIFNPKTKVLDHVFKTHLRRECHEVKACIGVTIHLLLLSGTKMHRFPFVLGMQTGRFPVINFTCLISQVYNFLLGKLGARVWHFIFVTNKKIHRKLIKG